MMKILKTLGLAAVGMLAAQTANAALISPDAANASSEFSASYVAENTINGSGLPTNFTAADAHADYAQGNHWTTDGSSPTSESITWILNSQPTLYGIVIWNHRSNIIAANSGYEPVLFDLTLSDYLFDTIIKFTDVALAPDTATGQYFDFGRGVNGVFLVSFNVKATQSSTSYTGLAEVAFEDAPPSEIPVAPALPLLLSGLAGLVALRVRHQRPA